MQESGAVIRVTDTSVTKGCLSEECCHRLEEFAHWPIVCYPLNPRPVGEGQDFLIIFPSLKGEALFNLNRFIDRFNSGEFVQNLPDVRGVIRFTDFEKAASSRSSRLLKQLYSECRDNPSKKLQAATPELPVPRRDRRKEQLCFYYMKHFCKAGSRCPYAHGDADAWCPRCAVKGHFFGTSRCKFSK